MPTTHAPRHGSLQYRPRKRAKKQHARVRKWTDAKTGKPLAFAGFKAGMTNVIVTDNRKNSQTKGRDINVPVTIIECPPLKIIGVRTYKKDPEGYGEIVATEVHFPADKSITRTVDWKKTGKLDDLKPEECTRATLLMHTQPGLTKIGQKKPQVIEVEFGGSPQETIDFAKETKEIKVEDILEAGQFVDSHSVSKGKGTAGPVKRFGVGLRSHRSEKSNRRAVLGPMGYAKVDFRAPQQGQLGYHLRTEYNKQVMAIVDAEQVQIKGGIVKYGNTTNTTLLLKGSVAGSKRRLITLTQPMRQDPKASSQAMELVHVSTRSQQGNQ